MRKNYFVTIGMFMLVLIVAMAIAGCGATPTATTPTPVKPTVTLLTENFGATDTATFFSAAYKPLSTKPSSPMYKLVTADGTVTVGSGSLVLNGGGRFVIGYTGDTVVPTTAGDTATLGELDLSNKNYQITFKVIAMSSTAATKRLQIYVNNTTDNGAYSIHGDTSRIYSEQLDAIFNKYGLGGTVTVTSKVGNATSFLEFRMESGFSVTIDDIVISY
ncbi:MAG TPA: hypothetical protein VEC37_12715 [Bacillota bacterium]|nr:hypothetical protein [Bacillota bacterium]